MKCWNLPKLKITLVPHLTQNEKLSFADQSLRKKQAGDFWLMFAWTRRSYLYENHEQTWWKTVGCYLSYKCHIRLTHQPVSFPCRWLGHSHGSKQEFPEPTSGGMNINHTNAIIPSTIESSQPFPGIRLSIPGLKASTNNVSASDSTLKLFSSPIKALRVLQSLPSIWKHFLDGVLSLAVASAVSCWSPGKEGLRSYSVVFLRSWNLVDFR